MDANVGQFSTWDHEEEELIASKAERTEAREEFRRAYVARIREQAAQMPAAKAAIFVTSAPIFSSFSTVEHD